MKIGVLALQGTFIEHYNSLTKLIDQYPNLEIFLVKTEKEILMIDGLIIPGGESTTIRKLLTIFNLIDPLKKRIKAGMPVYGTCAGLILLAKNIINETSCLDAMDITVRRNAFGSQIASFKERMVINAFSNQAIELVFIRAPWIEKVGNGVSVLAEYQGKIVAVRQNNILVTSFHPEFTDDLAVHQYFVEMVKKTLTE